MPVILTRTADRSVWMPFSSVEVFLISAERESWRSLSSAILAFWSAISFLSWA